MRYTDLPGINRIRLRRPGGGGAAEEEKSCGLSRAGGTRIFPVTWEGFLMAAINKILSGLLLAAGIFLTPGCVSIIPETSPDIADTVSARDHYTEPEFESELERIKKRTGTQRYKDWSWGRND
jgi:hypothetical protein